MSVEPMAALAPDTALVLALARGVFGAALVRGGAPLPLPSTPFCTERDGLVYLWRDRWEGSPWQPLKDVGHALSLLEIAADYAYTINKSSSHEYDVYVSRSASRESGGKTFHGCHPNRERAICTAVARAYGIEVPV